MLGRTFGRLTVLSRADNGKAGRRWNCVCKCGKTSTVLGQQLRNGEVKSCGCYSLEISTKRLTKHGHATGGKISPELTAWNNLRGRCYDHADKSYATYGRRGIRVCDRWMGENGFPAFIADMGPRPSTQHSIDRIDPNGDYEPNNCRWATAREQQNNRTDNHRITWNGRTQNISEWSRELGISPHTLGKRIERWPIDRAMSAPLRKDRRRDAKRV